MTSAEITAAAELMDLYQAMEDDLIRNLATRLSVAEGVTPETVAEWQAQKLSELGALNAENVRTLATYSGKTEAEIAKTLERFGYDSLAAHEKLYQMAFNAGALSIVPVPIAASPKIRQILDAVITNAKETMNLVNTTALQSTNQAFMRIVNQTYLETVTGAYSYTESIRKAVRKLADEGITGATYRSASGRVRNDQMDVAVRRNIVTSMSQTANKLQLQRAEDWGSEYVEVSSHMGARPDHAEWQGRVYKLKGSDEKYKNFQEATRYGEADGLGGVNCRHSFYPFFPGLSKQRYQSYDEKENAKAYSESQQQRKLEREIRAQKRRVLAADATGDGEEKLRSQLALKSKEAKLKDFLKETGRTKRSNRQQVLGFGQSQSSKAVWANQRVKMPEKYPKAAFNHILDDDKTISKEYRKALKTRFAGGTETAQKVFAKYVKPGSVMDGNYSGTAGYSPGSRKIKMNYADDLINTRGPGATYFHEHGHLVDHVGGKWASANDQFSAALQSDFDRYIMEYKDSHQITKMEEVYKAISLDIRKSDRFSAISDLMGGLSSYKVDGRWGHSPEYWAKDPKRIAKEAFAHMFEAQFDKERLDYLNAYFPTATSEFLKLLEGLM